MRRSVWFFAVLATLVVGAALLVSSCSQFPPEKIDNAIIRAQQIERACENYRERHDSYPPTLSALVEGSNPLLEDRHVIFDPWGSPFKYAVVTDANGGQEVYVWAERTQNGKLTFIGVKRGVDGKTKNIGY
jgi:hypothetical protein